MTSIKISFPLVQDEDDYPPFAVEDVWASSTDVPYHYVVDNIPFFARQVALGDTVRVVDSGGTLVFDEVVARSLNSLVRVVFFEPSQITDVRAELDALGCSTEAFKGIAIVAVNIPPNVRIQTVREYLLRLAELGIADYEEPILRHLSEGPANRC